MSIIYSCHADNNNGVLEEIVTLTVSPLRFSMARAPLLPESDLAEMSGTMAIQGAVYRVNYYSGTECTGAPAPHVEVKALVAPKREEEIKAVLTELGGNSGSAKLYLPEVRVALFPNKQMQSAFYIAGLSRAVEAAFKSTFPRGGLYTVTPTEVEGLIYVAATLKTIGEVDIALTLFDEVAREFIWTSGEYGGPFRG